MKGKRLRFNLGIYSELLQLRTRSVPRHLVADGALFVELGRGRGGSGQCRSGRSRLVGGSAALCLQDGGTAPLPVVVHSPQTHTTVVARGDQHRGQHIPTDAPHGTIVLAKLNGLDVQLGDVRGVPLIIKIIIIK